MNDFLPISRAEMEAQGITQCDFIVVTPDAYVDHPSFAMALIGRFVQSLGFSVGIIAQPDWKDTTDFMALGAPKHAFLVSGGNMDGVVALYTSGKHARRDDDYSPGGAAGRRPVRPTIAYTACLKAAFKEIPVIIGGVEPSNRRFAHYDYLEDKVRRSYLVDSKADLLVYGMGEAPLREICMRLGSGEPVQALTGIRGTCVVRSAVEAKDHITLPSYDNVSANRQDFAAAFRTIYQNAMPGGSVLAQAHGDRYLIQYPPSQPLSTPELDALYALPFTRRQHPSYAEPVPALQEVQFGVTALRGCPAQCSFCSISAHQGKRVTARSKRSVVEEVRRIAAMPEFKGVISDVGGPTANFYGATCASRNSGKCARSCASPKLCDNLRVSHKAYCELLEAVERVPGVRRVFIRSGIRYDYLMADKDTHFFDRLVKKHVSGQLKVAPEHVDDEVLRLMNKPPYAVYERFSARFSAATKRAGKPQFLLPYYISSHPGSTLNSAIALALALKKQGFIPEQVQDFYPTPGTLSTCMYHTGIDPLSSKPVYVARTPREKAMQRALLQFNRRQNWALVRTALKEADREDLIGQGRDCLVPAEGGRAAKSEGRAAGRAEKGSAAKSSARHESGAAASRGDGKPHRGAKKTGVSARPDGRRPEHREDGHASEKLDDSGRPQRREGAKPGGRASAKAGSGRPERKDVAKPGGGASARAGNGGRPDRRDTKPGGGVTGRPASGRPERKGARPGGHGEDRGKPQRSARPGGRAVGRPAGGRPDKSGGSAAGRGRRKP